MQKRTITSGPPTEAELSFVKTLIDDGWAIRQIRDTYGFSPMLMKRYFPDYRGMDFKTAGSIGRAIGRSRMKDDLVSRLRR